MATIDCKAIAKKIKEQVKIDIEKATKEYGEKPFLEIVQVGENPSSVSYVKSILKTCDAMGVNYDFEQFDENISEDELVKEIERLKNQE